MKPVIITVFDSEKGTTTDYPFAKSPIRIGRNPLNDLALPFPFVSGWHAVVRFDENTPRFFDLGSTNGTLHEGRRIQAGEPLDVGELLSVTIGRLELRLTRGVAEVQMSTRTAPGSRVPGAGPGIVPTVAQAWVPAPETGNLPPAMLGAQAAPPAMGPTSQVPAMPPLMPQQPPGVGAAHAPTSAHPPMNPQALQPQVRPASAVPPATQMPSGAAGAGVPMQPGAGHGQPLSPGSQSHPAAALPGHPGAPRPLPVGVPGQPGPQPGPPPAVQRPIRQPSATNYPAAAGAPPAAMARSDSSQAPQAVPSPEGTAHLQMGAIHDAIGRARPSYDALQRAAVWLVADLTASMQNMPVPLQQLTIPMVAREYPEVAALPQFVELANRVGAPLPSTAGAGGGGGAAMRAVQKLSSELRPEESPPKNPHESEQFLACVGEVLFAAAKAMIELQEGQEQFGTEMGVRVIKEYTPLHAAGTPENLLRYLLDWNKGGPQRTQELRGVYADLMIHQVALIRGVVEGARSLIAHLDPREIERGLTSTWPSKGAAAWKAYERLWQDISGSDQRITELIFGPDFARAYAEVGGEG